MSLNSERKGEIRKLDGILPEGVNRRKLLKASIATLAGSMAGCTAGSNVNRSTTTSERQTDEITKNVVWRNPWKAEPNYAVSYVSERNGFWANKQISPPSVREGSGSGDTAKRVGTGNEMLGLGEVTPQIAGFAQGYDMQIYGVGKARTLLALIYRKDTMNSGTDLEDKTIITGSALAEQSWPLYRTAVDAPESGNLEFADEAVAVSLLSEGEADAIWGTIDDFGPFASQVDVELGLTPLYNYAPIYGNTLIVNKQWLNEEDNYEFTRRVLEGYSEAGKWALLNPDNAIEILSQDVNQALQTEEKENLLENLRSGIVATNLTDGIKKNGFGYLNEDVLANSSEYIANLLDVEPTPVDEMAAWDLHEQAQLATFSKDEWNQLYEWAKPYSEIFENPE